MSGCSAVTWVSTCADRRVFSGPSMIPIRCSKPTLSSYLLFTLCSALLNCPRLVSIFWVEFNLVSLSGNSLNKTVYYQVSLIPIKELLDCAIYRHQLESNWLSIISLARNLEVRVRIHYSHKVVAISWDTKGHTKTINQSTSSLNSYWDFIVSF